MNVVGKQLLQARFLEEKGVGEREEKRLRKNLRGKKKRKEREKKNVSFSRYSKTVGSNSKSRWKSSVLCGEESCLSIVISKRVRA